MTLKEAVESGRRARVRGRIEYLSYPIGGVRYELDALDAFKRQYTRAVKTTSHARRDLGLRRLTRDEMRGIEEARIQRAVREVQKEMR
jgi:hypothetical protein